MAGEIMKTIVQIAQEIVDEAAVAGWRDELVAAMNEVVENYLRRGWSLFDLIPDVYLRARMNNFVEDVRAYLRCQIDDRAVLEACEDVLNRRLS